METFRATAVRTHKSTNVVKIGTGIQTLIGKGIHRHTDSEDIA
jgi:hypothetical protein